MIRFVSADTAMADVRYFVSELTRPELRFYNTSVQGARSSNGTWAFKEREGSQGTMF